MNTQQIAAAREIAAREQLVDDCHLAMMICSAIGVEYEIVISWIRASVSPS